MHLPVDRTAEAVRDAPLAVLAGLPEAERLTLTCDQGAEMAHQQQVAPLLRDGVLFAHPGRPSQRGTNEITNGPLRQYFPNRRDLSQHTAADLRAVEQRLNDRPRKTLGRRTRPTSSTPLWHPDDRHRCDDRSNPTSQIGRFTGPWRWSLACSRRWTETFDSSAVPANRLLALVDAAFATLDS
ncbi:IS30 family transposase [Micromonospora sp. LH3U1]|nr:IS30 family transposase [Micromonospora sp. LH3U1]WCN83854.1 IS30 family transposase [Micromonospora sp. LH3U1]